MGAALQDCVAGNDNCFPVSVVFLCRDADLVKPQSVPRGERAGCFLEDIGHFQEAAAFLRDEKRQRYLTGAVGGNRGQQERSSRDQGPVVGQSPGGADFLRGIQEIKVIFYGQDFPLGVVGGPKRPVDVLVLEKSRVRAPVGVDQSVQAEVRVMLQLSVISAVEKDVFAGRCFALVDGVVAPLPDKAAAESGIDFRQVPVFFEVAGAVAHGVAVFHQQERLVGRALQVVRHLGEGRVHAPEEVDVGDVELPVAAQVESAFVVGEPGGVRLFGPPQGPLESDAVAALIAHGPDQDAGTVAVPDDHGPDPVQRGLNERRVVGDSDMSQAHAFRVIILAKI